MLCLTRLEGGKKVSREFIKSSPEGPFQENKVSLDWTSRAYLPKSPRMNSRNTGGFLMYAQASLFTDGRVSLFGVIYAFAVPC